MAKNIPAGAVSSEKEMERVGVEGRDERMDGWREHEMKKKKRN